jgi:hypothetical protein
VELFVIWHLLGAYELKSFFSAKEKPQKNAKNIRRYRTKFNRPGFVHPSL